MNERKFVGNNCRENISDEFKWNLKIYDGLSPYFMLCLTGG